MITGLTVVLMLASLAPEAVVENRLDKMLRTSQQAWDELMPGALAAMREAPRFTIEYLVGRLDDGSLIQGFMDESTRYTICGNALTLLERLTEVRICHTKRDWIGYSTHDHRVEKPSTQAVTNPWKSWLKVRAALPVAEWFWGLSWPELASIQPLLHKPQDDWKPAWIEAARALGKRLHPLLVDKLLDDGSGSNEERVADRAHALLKLLTGHDPGDLLQHRLLHIDPADPMRAERLAIEENLASMRLIRARWLGYLLR